MTGHVSFGLNSCLFEDYVKNAIIIDQFGHNNLSGFLSFHADALHIFVREALSYFFLVLSS